MKVGSEFSEKHGLNFSVPQGCCTGPVLFLAYASSLEQIIPQAVDLHAITDDHALKVSFDPKISGDEEQKIQHIEALFLNIEYWMDSNLLKMNPSDTDFICFGSRQILAKC